jgi:glycosyltransferase involved in cell wall biosynthesis
LILNLLAKKYNVVYISFKPSTQININLRKNITCIELPQTVNRKDSKDKWIKTLIWYASMPKIRKMIEEIKPSFIVHKEQMPFIPRYLAKLKIPLLIDIGDWWWTTLLCKTKLGSYLAEKMENREVRLWNKHQNIFLTTHSNTEKEVLVQRGMEAKRITVVNHPSSDETYKPIDSSNLRKKLKLSKNFVVSVHGIIHPSKDYNLLLNWWKEISLIHKDWKLLIIGGTIGEEWCKNKIKKLGIEKTTLMTGWLKDAEEVNKYLNVSDCLLVTRKNNLANRGLIPSSLFHSLSLGKPVVITGLGGLSEIIRNKIDGFSYIPDNFDSFKETLEYIYNNPKKAKEIGKAGILRGKECFDPEKSAKGFFKVIDKNIKS